MKSALAVKENRHASGEQAREVSVARAAGTLFRGRRHRASRRGGSAEGLTLPDPEGAGGVRRGRVGQVAERDDLSTGKWRSVTILSRATRPPRPRSNSAGR